MFNGVEIKKKNFLSLSSNSFSYRIGYFNNTDLKRIQCTILHELNPWLQIHGRYIYRSNNLHACLHMSVSIVRGKELAIKKVDYQLQGGYRTRPPISSLLWFKINCSRVYWNIFAVLNSKYNSLITRILSIIWRVIIIIIIIRVIILIIPRSSANAVPGWAHFPGTGGERYTCW